MENHKENIVNNIVEDVENVKETIMQYNDIAYEKMNNETAIPIVSEVTQQGLVQKVFEKHLKL